MEYENRKNIHQLLSQLAKRENCEVYQRSREKHLVGDGIWLTTFTFSAIDEETFCQVCGENLGKGFLTAATTSVFEHGMKHAEKFLPFL